MTGDQPLRCTRCGEVIGAYEPLVVVQERGGRRTSVAAEPELARQAGERDFLHAGCAPYLDSAHIG